MAGAPGGPPADLAKSPVEGVLGPPKSQSSPSTHTPDEQLQASCEASGEERRKKIIKHRCQAHQTSKTAKAELSPQANTKRGDAAPFFYERKKRKRQRLNPCAAILARHLYAEDSAETYVFAEGVVTAADAAVDTVNKSSQPIPCGASSLAVSPSAKPSRAGSAEGEAGRKRKRLEQPSRASDRDEGSS
ncbi:hypothetical protein Efla_004348 [Eimeria flavescens]